MEGKANGGIKRKGTRGQGRRGEKNSRQEHEERGMG